LGELKPRDVKQNAFIQGLPFVWQWRRDSDVFGKPLSLGGEKFARGLGVAAFTRLSYDIGGRYRKFKAEIGILDSVASGGKTTFRVLVDGKEVFSNAKKPLTRGAKPRAINADVTGGKLLELVVDFGPDSSDLGDIGGWGEARLIK
ncbi:MAG: NPCBM/NEW2 domain-containing protein, partial [Planctomycetota bacterium]